MAFFKPIKEIKVVTGLKVAIWGPPETGKTYFCCTCPEPVYINRVLVSTGRIDTEWGCTKVAKQHFPDKDIRVYEVKVVESEDPTKIDYYATFKKIAEAVQALADVQEGTICIDSVSDIYTWLNAWVEETAVKRTSIGTPQRIEWGRRNTAYRNLIFRLLAKPVNVVITAQPQRLYGSRGEELNVYVPRWLEPQEHWADVVIKTEKKRVGVQIKYRATITKCRMMRAYNAVIENLTYAKLIKKLQQDLGVKYL